ncbi:DnaB-like helicase C-terminal domain-containing protein [Paenibacillus sp. GD4]|uniref:DnaB-like helicase C-terminal domain-containing protein n=1 Tax=Paenibacillus sp. GD4 TaxID=3068890 RepID=UPI002796BBBF|nr:DnaB-like helicase C-terminal domain-containing protein [Paenibacillus sp. GD4]MDQ1909448.1 DnaB-like helicase C-terminal domain-containing protein [Paenibacillus sp. GD4]
MSAMNMGAAKSSLDLEEMVAYYQKQLRDEAFFYLQKRGIEQETIENYRIGFDPGKIGFIVYPNKLGDFFENRVIIPVTNAEGVTVDMVGRSVDHREPKYKALLGMEDIMFNEEILEETEDVILCNGVFDVLSLSQSRLPAVCVPYWLTFKEWHAHRLKDKRVFICLGNDELGRRESVRIQTMLQESAKETYIVNLPESIRDVNDFFVRVQNPLDTFMQMLNQTMEETFLVPIAPDVKNITVYTEEYMKRYRGQVSGIPSGFKSLDATLYGGFRTGLYFIVGGASTGKSMLMKQIADHMAGEQTPVVYVSWDMTGFELWARSIARLAGIEPQKVLSGKVEPDAINEANKTYVHISKMLWTLECSLDTTLDKVFASIEQIAVLVGKTPVVFIDHLQRIPAAELLGTTRSWQERQTLLAYTLKQWSRENGASVIAAIPAELGEERLPDGVEASADVIMHLRALEATKQETEPNAALDLVKHRNGTLACIPLRFYDEKALFAELKSETEITGEQ